jgi:nitrate reductase NapE component
VGGGAAFGRLPLHARVSSAAVRSCHFVLVAAAVVPLSEAGLVGGFCSLE